MPRRDLVPVRAPEAYTRRPMSSRVNARVDIAFRLIDDPEGPRVGFMGLKPLSLDMDVTRPGEADTIGVTLAPDALPFDLELIAPKSMLISAWLFEHQRPDRCVEGDPGHFFGIVDDIQRNRYSLRVGLDGRDLTAIPLNQKMSEEQVKAFPIGVLATLEDVVLSLIRQIQGTEDWRVESFTPAALQRAVPPIIVPAKGADRSEYRAAARDVLAFAPKLKDFLAKGTWHLSDIVEPHALTVWTAICNVCARAGVVPEIRMIGGVPVILLVDGSQLQTTDVLRPFVRGNKRWRTLVDADGISELNETLSLSAGDKRPDFILVESMHPVTGRRLSARWPPAKTKEQRKLDGDDKTDEGEPQFVRGVASEEALLRMARAGWEALSHNQYRVEAKIKQATWSAGGSPDDPDLLGLGYGAAVEIALPAFDRLAHVKGLDSPEAILLARHVDPAVVKRIVRAQERLGAMSLLFQVERVKHSWVGGSSPSYECTIGMRRFLGTNEMPIFDSRVDLPRGFA